MQKKYESEFVEIVSKNSNKLLEQKINESKKEVEQSQARLTKLDLYIQRLYEDNVEGKVSDEQFIKMSSNYEREQSTLTARIKELQSIIKNEQEKVANTNSFLNLLLQYN